MTSGLRWTPEQVAAHQRRAGLARRPAAAVVAKAPKPPKYRNQPTKGHASAKEARRAAELRLLLAAGKIRNLREQVRYEVVPAQYDAPKGGTGPCIERSVTYVADFSYEYLDVSGGWHPIVEDCKGVRTKDYIIKRKLMLHVHNIRVRET